MFEDTATSEEITPYDDGGISLPPVEELNGFISPALLSHCMTCPVTITGLTAKGEPITLEIELSGRFLSAYLVILGHRVRKHITIGLKTDTAGWCYTADFVSALSASQAAMNPEKNWPSIIHTYFR